MNYLYINFICLFYLKLFIAQYPEGSEQNTTKKFTNEGNEETSPRNNETDFDIPEEKWLVTALKDIAYYLRSYKFNEWDRRYFNLNPETIGYYSAFPTPPLRSLHWKVYENCNVNFYKCIIYLHSVIETSPITRGDDTITIINENIIPINESLREKLNEECKNTVSNSEKTGLPFDGPIEKFQWSTSASYYMCWFTMLGTPELATLEESCDNFAHCLDPIFGSNNKDPRAEDSISFACALYSFCPDLCCPMKHIQSYNQCYENEFNPCYAENIDKDSINKICTMNIRDNTDFRSIVENKFNVSCHCNDIGFEWKSEYGMCVDVNECTLGTHNCSKIKESCLNIPGSFICICKWGHVLNEQGECVHHNIFKDTQRNVLVHHYNYIQNIVKGLLHYFRIKF